MAGLNAGLGRNDGVGLMGIAQQRTLALAVRAAEDAVRAGEVDLGVEGIREADRPVARFAKKGSVGARVDADEARPVRLRQPYRELQTVVAVESRIEIDDDVLVGHDVLLPLSLTTSRRASESRLGSKRAPDNRQTGPEGTACELSGGSLLADCLKGSYPRSRCAARRRYSTSRDPDR